METGLVTIRRFSTVWEAEIARAALEASEIPVSIADANTISANWLYSNAIGGVSVQVPRHYSRQALDVLPSAVEADSTEDAYIEVPITCPQCGGDNAKRVQRGKRVVFATCLLAGISLLCPSAIWLLAGVPLFCSRTRYKCPDCGKTWKKGQS